METFDGGRLFAAINGICNLAHLAAGNEQQCIPANVFPGMKENIDHICSELERMGLPATLASAKAVSKILHNGVKLVSGPPHPSGEWALFDSISWFQFRLAAGELSNRFKDELENRKMFVLSNYNQEYFDQSQLFGLNVFNKFPSANEDIYESGMCLALSRPTACVLHLNRALEVGLFALAKAVGVGKQDNWGAYIREINKELDKRMKASGARSLDEQFYSEASANFDRLKRAYRNPTMHPERTYTLDGAREIFLASKAFMAHLAERVSE